MNFKRVRANIRKAPATHIEALETRVLYSADVLSSLGINLSTAADDLSDDPDWPPHGGQQSVLQVAEPSQVEFKRSISVADFATGELNSAQLTGQQEQAGEPDKTVEPDTIIPEVVNTGDFTGEAGVAGVESECCPKELVFIDSRTPDYQSMVDDLRKNHPDTEFELIIIAVSYTHLTLPTIYSV